MRSQKKRKRKKTMCERESVVFPNVVARAQLTTSAVRPCTYFADEGSKRRFVKGPYASKEAAEVSILVTRFKIVVCPSLPFAPLDVRQLVPDGMPDCQFGLRTRVNRDEPHWFQVAADVFQLEGVASFPTTTKSSPKAWTKPVACVDWKKLAEDTGCYGEIPYEREYEDSIYAKDPESAKQLVMHTLLSWACGCGADLAPRNFLWFPKRHRVYQVDLESWCNGRWALSSAAIASNRNEKGPQMRRFVEENWKEYFEQTFEDCLSMAKSHLAVIMRPYERPEWEMMFLLKRLAVLCDFDKLVVMFPPKDTRKKKRAEEPEPEPEPEKRSRPSAREERAADEELLREWEERLEEAAREDEDEDEDEDPVSSPPPEPVEDEAKPFAGKAVAKHNHSVDPWGNKVDVVKSNFQKCVRRGNRIGALISFFTCYNMETLFPDSATAKALRTNVINRLLVCVAEDVGVANVALLKKCLEEALPMALRRAPRDPRVLGTLVAMAAASPKSRIQSHLYHAYAPENVEVARKFGLETKEPGVERLTVSDPNCFALVGKRDELLWGKISKVVPELAALAERAYDKAATSNKRAFLQCALTVAHFVARGGEEGRVLAKELAEEVPEKEIRPPLLADLLINGRELKPIPQAYDMHTTAVKKGPEAKKKFKVEGAFVSNVREAFFDPVLEKIYVSSKK